MNDQALAQEIQRRGWLSPQQLQWCWQELQRRRAQGQNSTLAHLLLEGQLLSPDQIQALTSAQANSGGESIDITLTVPTGMVAVPKSAFQNSSGSQSGPSQSGPGLKPPSYAGQSHSGSQELPGSQSIEQVAGSFDFEIEEKVAQGGMGAIYKARDPLLERQVAMKLSLTLGSEQAFFGEAKITGQLEHPNIIPIHNAGVTPEGKPYFTMKFVKGRTLEEALEEGLDDCEPGTWEALPRYLEVFLKLCDGMAFAHSKGIIHRDLKPENVMIGEFGEVLVLDWGLAKSKQEVKEGDNAGTPKYMAPEQAAGEKVTTRTDVYGLGAVLYQILCGQAPIEADDSEGRIQLMKKIMDSRIRPPTERNPDWAAPKELGAVAMKALSKAPRHRYRDVPQLQEDIRLYLDGRGVSAYSESFLEFVKKAAKRHRVALTTIVLSLGIVSVLGFGAYWHVYTEFLAVEAQTERAQSAVNEAEGKRLEVKQALDKRRETEAAEQQQKQQERKRRQLWLDIQALELQSMRSETPPNLVLKRFQDLSRQSMNKETRRFLDLRWGQALVQFQRFDQALKKIEALEAVEKDREVLDLRLFYYMKSMRDLSLEVNRFLLTYTKAYPKSAVAVMVTGLKREMSRRDRIRRLKKALQLDRRLSPALLNLSNEYLGGKRREWEEAVRFLNRCIEISPSMAKAYGNRGMAYFRLGHLEEAMDDLQQALTLDDGLAYVYRELGRVYRAQKQWDKALENYTIAVNKNPRDGYSHRERIYLCAQLKRPQWRSFLEVYAKAYPNEAATLKQQLESGAWAKRQEASAINSKGYELHKKGQYREALRYYEQGLKLTPDDLTLLLNAAEAYQLTNQPKKQRECGQRAATKHRDWRGYYQWAEAELSLGQLKAAEQAFVKAVNVARSEAVQVHILYQCVIIYFDAGQAEHGWRLFRKLKAKYSKYTEVLVLQGVTARVQKRYNESLDHLNKALLRNFPEARFQRALTYLKMGKTDKALSDLRIVSREIPRRRFVALRLIQKINKKINKVNDK